MADLQLDTLEAKGLIRLAQFQPELEYLFRHALVQDTAYESLLKQERRQLHRLVGDAIEDLYPDRRGDLAAVLAMHFEQAGDTDKAIRYMIAAAQFAYERNALNESFELYGRAAALLPAPADDDDNETIERRVRIQLGRVRAGFTFLPENAGIEILEAIRDDAERQTDRRLTVDVYLANSLLRQFRGERPDTDKELKQILERVSEIARELGDPLIAALPSSVIGLFQIFTGNMREGIATIEKVAPELQQMHDFVGSSFALVALAFGYARMGEFDKASKAAAAASEVAEKGDLIAKLDALIGESLVRSVRGDIDSAIPLASQCTNLAEQHGATSCVVASNFVLGDAYMRRGDFQEAQLAFNRGNEVADTIEQKVFRPSIAAYMRSNAASLGDLDPSTQSFDDAVAEAVEIGDRWGEANVLWKRAETEAKKAAGSGDEARSLEDFQKAADLFEDMGGRPYQARVLHGWGRALRAMGKTDEAAEKLREALQLFDDMGIKRDGDEVRLELATQPVAFQT